MMVHAGRYTHGSYGQGRTTQFSVCWLFQRAPFWFIRYSSVITWDMKTRMIDMYMNMSVKRLRYVGSNTLTLRCYFHVIFWLTEYILFKMIKNTWGFWSLCCSFSRPLSFSVGKKTWDCCYVRTPPIHLGHPEGVKRSFITVPNVNDTLHKGPKKGCRFFRSPFDPKKQHFLLGANMLLVVGSF